MPCYRLFFLRDRYVSSYREGPPHTKPYQLRIRDYEEGGEAKAATPYAAWKSLRNHSDARRSFGVGDALESDTGELLVLNYWGFDVAHWQTETDSSEEMNSVEGEEKEKSMLAQVPEIDGIAVQNLNPKERLTHP
jgi:hypothetical protein